ncbi:cilia- and flagella-associated protein 58 [Stomoxys calcitrans]|uniref:cilia- and flagella-associated protein 58 n=1 Tax=Stomoxys calcitrans TaxID=35570 RepID=UPI0027E39031|nr:cilia- and flagella-associated protein 58 [Stomoxys calcitrans]
MGSEKGSGSEDEPLVPDEIDDQFYKDLLSKIPEVTKALRQKDTQNNADNVQRLLICSNRYKCNLLLEQTKCQDFEDEVARLNGQLEDARKITELDQETIAQLREVIESAWRQKDAAILREQTAQDELTKLKEINEDQAETIKNLSDTRANLKHRRDDNREKENLKSEVKEVTKRLQMQRNYTTELEAMNHTLEEKNKNLIKVLDETSTEAFNSKKRIDSLTKDLNQMKIDELKYTEQIATSKLQLEKLTKMKVRQNLQILSLKTNLEHLNTQHNSTCNKLAKITVDLEYAIQERDKNKRDLAQKANLLKLREDEIIKWRQENSKLAKLQDNASRKYCALEETRKEIEDENIRLKTQFNTQEKEFEAMRRVAQQLERNNNNLTKERDTLKRDLLVEHTKAEEFQETVQETQHEIRALKDSLLLQERKHKKLLDDIAHLNNDKTKKMDDIQNLLDKMDALQNKIHLKESYELELKRTVSDAEAQYSKLKAQHEILVNENTSNLRNIQNLNEEKTKLRKNIENLQNAIETLKAKVAYRDGEIGKLQLQVDKMEKERRMLKNELRTSQLNHQHTRNELFEKKKENDKFLKSQQEEIKKLTRLQRDLDNMIDEKNSVCAALNRKEEQYNELKMEMENLQRTHDLLQSEFSQNCDDMKLMRTEIKNLLTERNVLRKDRENAANLRQELLQMHRVLNQQRVKARALQEEMMTPMNVHRWRNLKGKDPHKCDLIQKIQFLRKQLLHYNVTNLEQERALKESQRLYTTLKEFIVKLPNIKIKEELNEVKSALSLKNRKLKALKAEISTKAIEEKSHSVQLEELKNDLTKVKNQLLQERKSKEKLMQERQTMMQMQIQCMSAPPHLQTNFTPSLKHPNGI